jgi:hypothetical protein
MVKCSVLFEAWTEFLNIIKTSFDFKGLKVIQQEKNFMTDDFMTCLQGI